MDVGRISPGRHGSPGQFHGFKNLRIAGATAQIASQGAGNLVPIGSGVVFQQGDGATQDSRCAESALRGPREIESLLKRMGTVTACNSLYGSNITSYGFLNGKNAGENRLTIQKHGAGSTVALITPLLRAGQTQDVP